MTPLLCLLLVVAPGAVRGRVLHGSEVVPGALVSLVERDPGLVAVGSGGARPADAEGRFEFAPVDTTRRWLLVVFDPYRPGKISVVTQARTDADNTIHVNRLISFEQPPVDALVPGPDVPVRFSAVPGAARYILEVEESSSRARRSQTLSEPRTVLRVQPARTYTLSVTAQNAAGVEIGANIIHGGASFTFGVSDPVAESALGPAEGECTIAGQEPHLRVAPSDSPAAHVAFMVSRGDRVRLLGRWKTWLKVRTLTGYYPGRLGWLAEGELACPSR